MFIQIRTVNYFCPILRATQLTQTSTQTQKWQWTFPHSCLWFATAERSDSSIASECSHISKLHHVHPLHLPSGHYPHDWRSVSGASRQVHHCGVHVSGLGITSVCNEIHWRVQTKGLAPSPTHQQCSNRICAFWWATVILNTYVCVCQLCKYICMLLYYSFPKQDRYISSIVNDATTSKHTIWCSLG